MTDHTIPIWTEPVDLGEDWPTNLVENQALGYRFTLPVWWSRDAQITQMPSYREEIYRGEYAAELASISFMPQADPSANIRNWVEGMITLAGFPILELAKVAPPRMLEWQYEGSWPALAERLHLDECHTYQGLAHLSDTQGEVARFYILLARRGRQAWKVTFSILSACLPGMPERDVYENDHVRACASFGNLELFTATEENR